MIINLYTKSLSRWKDYALGYSINPKDYENIIPIINYSRERDKLYHPGRIVWFCNLFINNCTFAVHPIDIWVVNYEILIVDGYHRLAGAILAGEEYIRCKVVKRINER